MSAANTDDSTFNPCLIARNTPAYTVWNVALSEMLSDHVGVGAAIRSPALQGKFILSVKCRVNKAAHAAYPP